MIWLYLIVTSTTASAQVGGGFLKDFAKDQGTIWTSPFRSTSKNKALKFGLPMLAVTGALIANDRRIMNGLSTTPDRVRWSGRASNAGALMTLAGASAVTFAAGQILDSEPAREMGRSASEALVHSFVLTAALKTFARRDRPEQNNNLVKFFQPSNGRAIHTNFSFPSGHAMTTFAVASAVAGHRRCPKWLAVTLYAGAAAVSLSRVGARKHFPSDVVFGGGVGWMIGHYFAGRNR